MYDTPPLADRSTGLIVFCHLLNDNSGSPAVLRSTLRALKESTDMLLYVGSQGRGVLDEAEVPIRRYWYRRSRFRILTFFTYFASQICLYRSLVRARDIPDDAVIYVNTLLPFAAMVWGKLNGRRVVVHVHEVSVSPAALRRWLVYCATKFADHLLYVSNDHFARLPIDGPDTKIVFNPVNPALSAYAKTCPDYAPRRSGAFEVLMLASLRGYKGIEEFVALARATQHRVDIHFTLVLNAGPAEVARLAAKYCSEVNITFHSRTNNPSVFYAKADLLLNLSRPDQWIETFGLTLIEGMTFGLPVIAPPLGGPIEIVTDGREGFCIDSRNSTALERAVYELADNPDHAMAMSYFASQRACKFNFDIYAQLLRNMHKQTWSLDIASNVRNIAILGTVGIPSGYGGFETLAENLVRHHFSCDKESRLTVWCSAKSVSERPANFLSASLRYLELKANGLQSTFYDLVSMVQAIRSGHNEILLLGVSGAVCLPLIRLLSNAHIVTNIDGMEWKREKWRWPARFFLRVSEWAAVRFSHDVIADNQVIADYVNESYSVNCHVIAYGGDHALVNAGREGVPAGLPTSYAFALCRI